MISPNNDSVSNINLFASIKRSSKYYYQGLDSADKPKIFPVEEIRNGSHPFRLNDNNYRRADLALYIRGIEDQLVKL